MKDKGLLGRAFSLIKSAFGGSFSESLSQTHGAIGRLFGAVVDIYRVDGQAIEDDVRKGMELLEQSGFAEDGEPDPRLYNYETVVRVPNPDDPNDLEFIRYGEPQGPIVVGGSVQRRPTFNVDTVPVVGAPGSRNRRIERQSLYKALEIDNEEEEDVISNLIQTPESSNVFAFGYDEKSGILYVQYKADGAPSYTVRKRNTCNGKMYQMQHRMHIPGPLYAYGSRSRPIPPSIFNEMKRSISKGEFVWDRLRVCGSLWDHQYPYRLVTPTFIPIGNGVFGAYTPRKASRQGFRVRTVAAVGTGKRPFLVSNLPGYNNPRALRK